MSDLSKIQAAIRRFRDERDWMQFHNPKDMAAAIAIEAAELQEILLWKSQDESSDIAKAHRQRVIEGIADLAPTSDSTPPTLSILKWERNPQGGQGSQTQIQPGGKFTVAETWLGTGGATNKADIRLSADDNGVRQLIVTGSAKGTCSALDGGQSYTSPGPLTVSFPQQSETASPGTVKSFMTVHLDGLLANTSCGFHRYANMPRAVEFFLDSAVWTVTATAENCCGGKSTGTFTITVF